MNTRKRLKKDFDRIEIPPKEKIIPHIRPTRHASRFRTPAKRWLTAPMAIAIAMILVIGVAAAGSIILSQLNANVLTGNNVRLEEVPEGYVGIYTIEDLMAINTALQDGTQAKHYILMNDIIFSDADFAPGGICEDGWNGISTGHSGRQHLSVYDISNTYYDDRVCFINGNGHVIRNLRIDVDVTDQLRPSSYLWEKYGTLYAMEGLFAGLFATDEAVHIQIINLGMENCTVNIYGTDIITNTETSSHEKYFDVMIGGIAAAAEYIGGCYIDGLTMNVELNAAPPTNHNGEVYPLDEVNNYYDLAIGAIAGYAQYVDACYATDIKLRVTSGGSPHCDLSLGGIAGNSTSCLTSYFEGEIRATGDGIRKLYTNDICSSTTESLIPKLLNQKAYELFKTAIEAKYGENSFQSKKILAYFVQKDLNREYMTEAEKDNLTPSMERWSRIMGKYNASSEEVLYEQLYIFDPSTPFGAEIQLCDLITSAFESEDHYIQFCAQNGIKVGQLYCYTFEKNQTVTENDAIGFDFDTLWTIRDGRPRLRIFER